MARRSRLNAGLLLALLCGAAPAALAQGARVASVAPLAQPLPAPLPGAAAHQQDAFRPDESRDAEPAFGPLTLARTREALANYERIAGQGGWRPLPVGARGLKQGATGALVLALKERLAVSGDLDEGGALSTDFDAATAEALRRFQARHGLTETGAVGPLTFQALNVPAEVRLRQLRATVERLQNNVFRFERRYVVVNIPGAVVEAVRDGRVERRHLAVVGRKDRPSPVISARISSINLNPHWTVPNSIIKNDVAKALKKDPAYLHKHNLRTLNHRGEEIDPNTVNWGFTNAPGFLLRQDPGPQNALGQLKIDMPNVEAVYMHDTPMKDLFRRDVRFHSSGCARVSDVRDLAAWLLDEQGIGRAELDRDIDAGLQTVVRLKRPVPVAWVYLTGYADGQGRVQFREDIYGLDTPEGVALTTLDGRKRVRPNPSPPVVASRDSPRAPAPRQASARPGGSADPIVTGAAPASRSAGPSRIP